MPPAGSTRTRRPASTAATRTPARRRSSAAVAMPTQRRGPALTPEGRAELAARAEHLRTSTLPQLRPLLVEWQRDERHVAEFERVQAELDRLELLLAEADTLATDPVAFDGRVDLGARVTLETPDGERTTVRIVHPEEAFLDAERVSSASPLAVALLGARAGHTVWVAAPTGPWPCRVVDVRVDAPAEDLDGERVA